MRKPIKVLLLYGGKSGEHEISLLSAASVLNHLDSNKYQIIPVAISQEGLIYQNDYQALKGNQTLPVITHQSIALDSLLANGKLVIEADIVFPVIHGPLYEDGCLQGLLEISQTPYVGAKVMASAIGMNKVITKQLLGDDILSARYFLLSYQHSEKQLNSTVDLAIKTLGFPLFVKPNSLGSSVGIEKVKDKASLMTAISKAFRYDTKVLIEENIVGREIEVAVLEDSKADSPKISVLGEIKVNHPDGFYSYNAKYLQSQLTKLIIPADISHTLTMKIQTLAGQIFTKLQCQGYARIDFFVNEATNQIYLNEINTLPGFTTISMFPKLWQASGLEYSNLLDELINVELIRYNYQQKITQNYSTIS